MEEENWNLLAKDYHLQIISPFYGKVKNPIYRELSMIEDKEHKSVGEFGCGFFYLGRKLSKSFKSVYASDFSSEMVCIAKMRSRKYENVTIKKEDMRTMRHRNKFDVVIAVNSILMSSFNDIKRSLSNIYRSMKKEGTLLLILPSIESTLYHGMLLLHYELQKRKESSAKRTAKRNFEKRKYDLFFGYYKDDGLVQKFYYKHEIKYLLMKSGFSKIKFKKVEYPWGEKISDYKPFPKEMPLWDWFVVAKKTNYLNNPKT